MAEYGISDEEGDEDQVDIHLLGNYLYIIQTLRPLTSVVPGLSSGFLEDAGNSVISFITYVSLVASLTAVTEH